MIRANQSQVITTIRNLIIIIKTDLVFILGAYRSLVNDTIMSDSLKKVI